MAKTTFVLPLMLLVASGPVALCAETDFAAIDAHARSAPPSVSRSIDSVAAYLTAPAQDDRERARALFTWIAVNVNYDSSLLGKPPDPEVVLEKRRAVCAGYAALFKALAEAAGLEAQIIHGYAKGTGPEAAIESDGLLTHDWNAVRIDGEWTLLDCTWGAGRLDEQYRFRKRFTEHYFLTSPEMLVYDHFPLDDKWQLLRAPISKGEFLARAWVQPAFFEHDLRLVSHGRSKIEADDSLAIVIGAPEDTLVLASMSQNGWGLEEGHTFAQRGPDGFVIRAAFPAPGNYVLRIFARRRNARTQEYESAVDYIVRAKRSTDRIFPKMYVSFQERGCYLTSPISGILKADAPVEFRVRIPGAEDVVVGVNGLARHLGRAGDGAFAGKVVVERGQAAVFGRFPGSKRYEGLLLYEVR